MSRSRANADVFQAIADPSRRRLLDLLQGGPVPFRLLAADFEHSRPAVSKHLRVLREVGLVSEQRHGRERHYRLEPGPLREVAGWVDGYRTFWAESLGNLKRMLEGEK